MKTSVSAGTDALQLLPRVEVLEVGGEVRVELEVRGKVLKVVVVWEVVAVVAVCGYGSAREDCVRA